MSDEYDKKGGSAFPWMESGVGGETMNGDAGMTLRDWFAGQALAGFEYQMMQAKHIASSAYELADAMLEVRK